MTLFYVHLFCYCATVQLKTTVDWERKKVRIKQSKTTVGDVRLAAMNVTNWDYRIGIQRDNLFQTCSENHHLEKFIHMTQPCYITFLS